MYNQEEMRRNKCLVKTLMIDRDESSELQTILTEQNDSDIT